MEEIKEQPYKSRNLNNYEYLQVLQKEYIVAEIRSKIYIKPKDKEYWRRVKFGKKAKIEDISTKNHLPNIFNDNDVQKDIEREVYGSGPLPNFIYSSNENKQELEYLDLQNYFNKNTTVKVLDYYGEEVVGEIVEYKPFFSSVKVSIHKEDQQHPQLFDTNINNIRRLN